MSNNRRKTNNLNRENVLNELLNELDEEAGNESGFTAENVSKQILLDGGAASDTAEENADIGQSGTYNAKALGKKHRFYFAFAIFMTVMTVVGIVATVLFAVDRISEASSSNSLIDEYTRFLLPVVANDTAPFDAENELSNTAKINCSIWNLMLNHDISSYRLSDAGEMLIPEYDVEYSCKEIFGSSAGLIHRTVGSTDMSFTYDSDNHVYSCVKDLRYLNYVPVITEMTHNGGIYTLTVDYYSPSVRFLAENMGIESKAEKTMKYVISRYDGKNTLVAVQFTSDIVMS